MKYLAALLLFLSPPALADVTVITLCSVPVTFIMNDDKFTYIVTPEALKESLELRQILKRALGNKVEIIRVDRIYPVQCPNSA